MIQLALVSLCFRGSFSQQAYEGTEADSISGTFCVETPLWIYMDVQRPVRQVFTYRADTLLIYYPEENRGFLVYPSTPLDLPLMKVLWPLGISELGLLEKFGYRLTGTSSSAGVVSSTWSCRGSTLTVTAEDGLMTGVKMQARKTTRTVVFSDYTRLGDVALPCRIEERSEEAGRTSLTRVTLSGLEELDAAPPEMRDFGFPDGCEVQVTRW